MASNASFQYTALSAPNNIRLIALDPVTGDDEVRCSLIETSLEPNPSYEALSYEWGSPAYERVNITINGAPHQIRFNLYTALFHLRLPSSKRMLWIDALSIDQSNIAERNFQVSLMDKIYSNARDVLIWLGLPRDDFELAIDYLRTLSQGRNARINRNTSQLVAHNGPQKAHGQELAAVANLCEASYWKRMWIIQEVQLASYLVIHTGESSMSWDAFAKAMRIIVDSEAVMHIAAVTDIRNSLPWNFVLHKGQAKRPLRTWMEEYQDSQCEDPRDKVFALLALANDCKGVLVADYSKTLSEVYRDVLTAHIYHGYGIYDLVGFSERLQFWLGQTDDTISLPLSDNEPIWLCGTFSSTITEIDRLPFDSRPSAEIVNPKPIFTTHSDTNLAIELGTETSSRLRSHIDDSFTEEEEVIVAPPSSARLPPFMHRTFSSMSDPTPKLRDFAIGTGNKRLTGTAPMEARMGDAVIRFASSSGTRTALILRRRPLPDLDDTAEGEGEEGHVSDAGWMLVGRAKMFLPYVVDTSRSARLWPWKKGDVDGVEDKEAAMRLWGSVYLRLSYASLQRISAV